MVTISYLWYKICKKICGSAIKQSFVHRDAKVEAGSILIESSMQRFSYCGSGCLIVNTSIGAFCSISDNVQIGGGNHPLKWVSTSPAFYHGRDSISKRLAKLDFDYSDKKTTIGNDVWIGKGVYIKPGVTIGNGAVLGMGSVVTRDVSEYSIVAGNPAHEISKRFDERTIRILQRSNWWNWEETKLVKFADKMNDTEAFIEAWGGNNLDV